MAASLPAQPPPPIQLPPAGKSYTDPLSGNRVWRLTDRKVCPGPAKHTYSNWPVWNQDGSHLIIECEGTGALLIRDADLKVLDDALRGAPGGLNPGKLFWSWTDPGVFYGYRGMEVWKWNPFTRKGARVAQLGGIKLGKLGVYTVRLAYVSFDDRYLLLELQGPNLHRKENSPWDVIGLLTYDTQTGKVVGLLDVSTWGFYDEGVFTRDNHVWVVSGENSFRYDLAFNARVRVAEHGHHAHGLLPDGTPVAVKAGSNRNCSPGSASGNPREEGYPQQGWKPTAVVLDERVDTTHKEDGTLTGRNDPLRSELFRVACGIPGQHNLDHFSWNNRQSDMFFISTFTYGDHTNDPLANAVLRVRLRFNEAGKITGDSVEVVAQHRSRDNSGYWASPRASCNQQGTRCLFASAMNIATDNTKGRTDLYIVDVPPPK